MAESVSKVLEVLQLCYRIDKIVYWTDSSVLLPWVNNKNKSFEIYMQNWLTKLEINISPSSFFKLIPSKLYPVDIGTHSLSRLELRNSKFSCKAQIF